MYLVPYLTEDSTKMLASTVLKSVEKMLNIPPRTSYNAQRVSTQNEIATPRKTQRSKLSICSWNIDGI
jgi:hypothetical protein